MQQFDYNQDAHHSEPARTSLLELGVTAANQTSRDTLSQAQTVRLLEFLTSAGVMPFVPCCEAESAIIELLCDSACLAGQADCGMCLSLSESLRRWELAGGILP